MDYQINYTTLMPATSEVGNEPTRFSVYRDGDKPKLLDDGRVSFLFVLNGNIKCLFSGGVKVSVEAPQMVILDKLQLREIESVGDTVLLECVMSDEMNPFVQSTNRAFSTLCSDAIPLNDKLQEWCKTMFTNLSQNPNRSNDYHHRCCSELTALLLEYPRNVLGIIYVPLYACSNHCYKCTRTFVRGAFSEEQN